ncbi:MAG TPA: hypothetical protein DCM67_05165 [Propionibacteriaceae bacterium]|nr:hypothetical protein [Propionibacteriaceae bacterium]
MERSGSHRATLDLKSGVHCVVELVRVLSLANGIAAVNTIERLRAASATGAFSADSENALLEAFEFITYLRLRHQAQQAAAGITMDNSVSPDDLTALEKKHLRDAFGIIRRAQQGFAYRYQTHLMS